MFSPITIGHMLGKRPKPPVVAGKKIKSPAYTGVEMEFSSLYYSNEEELFRMWRLEADGSLRGNRPGELVFAGPLAPHQADEALGMMGRLVLGRSEVNHTCSLHVHVDVCDLTLEELYRALFVYAMIERPLYRYCGGDRANNNFCVPLHKSIGGLKKYLRAQSPPDVPIGLRYCGLNLAALRKFGSLEFRMHPATKDLSRIIEWINLCCLVKEQGRKVAGDPGEWFNRCRDDPEYVIEGVFEEFAELLIYPGLQKDLLEGVVVGKEIYYAEAAIASEIQRSRYDSTPRPSSPFSKWQKAQPQTVREETIAALRQAINEYSPSLTTAEGSW